MLKGKQKSNLLRELLDYDSNAVEYNKEIGLATSNKGYMTDNDSRAFESMAMGIDRRRRLLAEAGPCQICGSPTDLKCLFKKKNDQGARRYKKLWSQKEDNIRLELKEAYVIVCGLCTASGAARKELDRDTPHGTVRGYNYYNCRCDKCLEAKRRYMKRNTGFKFDPRRPLNTRTEAKP